MNKKDKLQTVLILGGYGNAGLPIAKLLIHESNVHLIIAGRNIYRAKEVAAELNHEFQTDRVSYMKVDASVKSNLKSAFEGVTIAVIASSTIDYAHLVATSAIEAGVDYYDVQLSTPEKIETLFSLREEIEEQGRCFITDGGYHPGLPAVLVRYAATKFDSLEVANIGGAFQLDLTDMEYSKATPSEFIDELKNFNPSLLKNGEWVQMDFKNMPVFDFGGNWGKKCCTAMFMEELRTVPKEVPSLKEMGFYIAGFNWVNDYIIMPIAFTSFKLFGVRVRDSMGKFFRWGLKKFSKPPYGSVVQLEAKGHNGDEKSELQIRLTHYDAYWMTAVPVAACLLQYLSGDIRKPGLWFQANAVEPIQFLEDMERLGITITITE